MPVVGELDGRVPVVDPDAPPVAEFEALLPVPHGLLVPLPDWPLSPELPGEVELPGEADGFDVPPVPDCANARPALLAIKAAVRIAIVDRDVRIVCSLLSAPRRNETCPRMFRWNSNYLEARECCVFVLFSAAIWICRSANHCLRNSRMRPRNFALDQCRPGGLSQVVTMFKPLKNQSAPAANLAAMSDRLDLPAVPAAWPAAVSPLARAIERCQGCDTVEVCNDWLARAPAKIASPPVFCPNAEALILAKEANKQTK
jgi:hypothetical protein